MTGVAAAGGEGRAGAGGDPGLASFAAGLGGTTAEACGDLGAMRAASEPAAGFVSVGATASRSGGDGAGAMALTDTAAALEASPATGADSELSGAGGP